MVSYEEFVRRADAIRSRIAAACERSGRQPGDVELLAVTKTHPAEAVRFAARYGLRAVGENRVQEGVAKRSECDAAIAWELIGHLQSNKARVAAAHFDRIQSVDSLKLVGLLDRAALELGRTLPILIQVNAGRDEAKFGLPIEETPGVLEQALGRPSLKVEGLMTIAPLSADPDVARRTFSTLRQMRDELRASTGAPLPVLSMGMTGDLDQAIEEGSTLVRVGTALFGAREAF